jgi:hypothetical protein
VLRVEVLPHFSFHRGLVGHVWNLFVVWILVSVELFLIRAVYTGEQLLTYMQAHYTSCKGPSKISLKLQLVCLVSLLPVRVSFSINKVSHMIFFDMTKKIYEEREKSNFIYMKPVAHYFKKNETSLKLALVSINFIPSH